jgi:uncharacterized caspase-like protein
MHSRIASVGYCLFVLAMLVAFTAQAQERVALVIGNGAYQSATRLPNPSNDAADMASALRALDFTVVVATDVDKGAFDRKLREFAHALRTARTAVFFYAGHGIQVAGKNYAIPVDAKLETAADLQVETVDIDQIVAVMQSDENRVNLVFLDACRDNPLTRSFARGLPATRAASVGAGLSALEAGRGTLIAFSTAPNKVALDGSGRNSPFTQALLKHIRTPGLDIAFVMRRVTAEVETWSGGKQVPWMHASLTTDVVLARGPAGTSAAAPPAPPAGPAADEIAWSFLKDSKDSAQLQWFLDRFPTSARRPEAAARIAALRDEAARASLPANNAPAPAKPNAGAQQAALTAAPTMLAQYEKWGAYVGAENGIKVCYALSRPDRSDITPRNAVRDPTFMMVANRPAKGIKQEVSIIFGYPFKPDADATVEIGSSSFPMYTRDQGGWIKNPAEEARLIEAMNKDSKLVVKGTSARGVQVADYYSLRGLARALDRAAQECR